MHRGDLKPVGMRAQPCCHVGGAGDQWVQSLPMGAVWPAGPRDALSLTRAILFFFFFNLNC